MKTALFLLALCGVASGLKVREEFFQYTSAELLAPLNDVIKEVRGPFFHRYMYIISLY